MGILQMISIQDDFGVIGSLVALIIGLLVYIFRDNKTSFFRKIAEHKNETDDKFKDMKEDMKEEFHELKEHSGKMTTYIGEMHNMHKEFLKDSRETKRNLLKMTHDNTRILMKLEQHDEKFDKQDKINTELLKKIK